MSAQLDLFAPAQERPFVDEVRTAIEKVGGYHCDGASCGEWVSGVAKWDGVKLCAVCRSPDKACWCCGSAQWRLGRFHAAALRLQAADSSLDHTNALRVAKFRAGAPLRGEAWFEGAADFAHPESDFACRSLEAVMASAMLFKVCPVSLDDLVRTGGDRRCTALVKGKRCVFNSEHAAFGGKCSDKEPRS